MLLCAAQLAMAGGSVFSPQPTGDPAVSGGVRAVGLGGAGLAIWDSLGFHSDNAAAAANMTGALLRAGVRTGLYTVTDNNSSDSDSEFGWQAFRLYLNVHSRYKMGIGIDPVSSTDFRKFARDTLSFPGDSGTTYEVYEDRVVWKGSSLNVRWDHALKLSNRFAIGATAAFTSTYREVNNTLDFFPLDPDEFKPDSSQRGRDVYYHSVQRFKGFWGGLSIIAQPTDKWSVGAYWNSQAEGNWQTENSINNGRELSTDDVSGNRPGEFGLGVGYRWTRNWAAYADVKQQSWTVKQFGPQFDDQGLDKTDAFAIMLGAEKLGGTRITDEGFDRWDYRAGVAYRKQPWQVITPSGTGDVTETALSLGVSIPLTQQAGRLHTALEFGQRSAADVDVSEIFTRFYLQLDMHEQWFKRTQRKLRD